MEGLYRELAQYQRQFFQPSPAEPMVEGPLEDRIAVAVQRRVSVFERAAPFLRSGASLRWRSRFLTKSHAEMVRDLRADLLRALPELEKGPVSLLEAADLLTSFEAWDRLRTDQKLGRERAQRVVEDGVRVLLGQRPIAKPGRKRT